MKKTILFVVILSGLSARSTPITKDYHYVWRTMTWIEARRYCRETFTDLASIKNKADNNRLLSVLPRIRKYAWIGLRDFPSHWTWRLGQEAFNNNTDFSNWISSESKQPSRSCTAMSKDGFWFVTHCSAEHHAVCYYEQGPSKYILVEKNMNWRDAKNYCRSKYTDLASARNMSENNDITSLLTKKSWIGLYRNHWSHWSDQSSVTFTNWKTNQPDRVGITEKSCAKMETTTGQWGDVVCNAKHHFICQKDRVLHKTKLKLKFQSEADLNDPAVQRQVLEQLHAQLEKHGLADFKLRWMQTDGQTFHKKQEARETKATEQCGGNRDLLTD